MNPNSDSKITAAITATKHIPSPEPVSEVYRSGAQRLYAAVLNMRRVSEARRLAVTRK